MFKSRTVFVLGAGASAELGLPVGTGLMRQIGTFLDRSSPSGKPGDEAFAEALGILATQQPGRQLEFLNAAKLISINMDQAASIDNFLHTHQTNGAAVTMGKLAICHSILEAEASSRLLTRRGPGQKVFLPTTVYDSWFRNLLHMIVATQKKEAVPTISNNVSFVTFNYDRTLEEYLFYALKLYFDLDDKAASALALNFKILHPFGRIGPSGLEPDGVAYGAVSRYANLVRLTRNIRTFTEGVNEEQHLLEIRKEISEAETVVFLGFAFHSLNMKILQPSGGGRASLVLGTAFGESESNRDAYVQEIRRMFSSPDRADGPVIKLENMKCAQLLQDFSRTLMRD